MVKIKKTALNITVWLASCFSFDINGMSVGRNEILSCRNNSCFYEK
jgi:hypothetical protein